MSLMDSLSYLLPGDTSKFSKIEKLLLEAKFFILTYQGICEGFRLYHQTYIKLLNLDPAKEVEMINANFLQYIINDILSTEEYSLTGIAFHTRIPEDVIYDLAAGINLNPSLEISSKLIELHTIVRRELYGQLVKKVIAEVECNSQENI